MKKLPMKKILIIALALLMALSLAACGDGGSSSDDSNSNGDATMSSDNDDSSSQDGTTNSGSETGQAAAPLINWMIDSKFSCDYDLIAEGPDGRIEGSGSMAIDGDKVATSMEMTVAGLLVKSRTIKLGDNLYIIDDVNKFIMEMSGLNSLESAEATGGMMGDYSGIKPTGSGTGEINGRTLPYEEYAEAELGASVKYFLDGGDVYGIVSEYEGYKITMIIRNAKNSAPAVAFELPTGYSSMDGFDLGDFDLGDFNLEDFLPEGFEMPQ